MVADARGVPGNDPCAGGENSCDGCDCEAAEEGLSLGGNEWLVAGGGERTDWMDWDRCCAKYDCCCCCSGKGPVELAGCGVYGEANDAAVL